MKIFKFIFLSSYENTRLNLKSLHAQAYKRARANSIIMSYLFDEILLTVILTVSKDNPD